MELDPLGGDWNKYFQSSDGTEIGAVSPGCLEFFALGGAVAFDAEVGGCWSVLGTAVIIGDIFDTEMSGKERANWNFHAQGTQKPVPDQYWLPGTAFT
jgi:hypothetical protein